MCVSLSYSSIVCLFCFVVLVSLGGYKRAVTILSTISFGPVFCDGGGRRCVLDAIIKTFYFLMGKKPKKQYLVCRIHTAVVLLGYSLANGGKMIVCLCAGDLRPPFAPSSNWRMNRFSAFWSKPTTPKCLCR